MDYLAHYHRLIDRARDRVTNGYVERHHILPRCLGGTDDKSNIVELTPEEHYVAHQLLVKIHPNHYGLIWAAIQMTAHPNGKRSNKVYGWLRRRASLLGQQRIGCKNGSYGKPWYHDPITLQCGKFLPGTEPVNWEKGRCAKLTSCEVCNTVTKKRYARWCDRCRPTQINKNRKPSIAKQVKTKDSYSESEKMEALRRNNGNIRKTLFDLGLNDSGAHYRRMKQLKLRL